MHAVWCATVTIYAIETIMHNVGLFFLNALLGIICNILPVCDEYESYIEGSLEYDTHCHGDPQAFHAHPFHKDQDASSWN